MSVEGPSAVPESGSDNMYYQIVEQSRRAQRLFGVHWELTYRCNEKCTHCYLDVLPSSTHVPGELTTAECFRVVDQLAELGTLNLTLSGGDVLVRSDWFQIAQYAREKKFLLRLFTNGIQITPTVADHIASLHPYAVEISLYSVTPETHDRITQVPRSFELTTRAFRLLQERGVRTLMKTPIMHENVREFDQLKALAQSLGALFRYDFTISTKLTGVRDPLKHRMSYQDLVQFMRGTLEESFWVNNVLAADQRTCGIGSLTLLIDPLGNVFPCVETRIKAGNVREQPLAEIWKQSPVLADLRQITLQDLPVCRTCELRNLCKRCHGLALVEDGDLLAPALPNCHQALARRQVLIERGKLPADFPVPAHLRDELIALESERGECVALLEPSMAFVPLNEIPAR